MAPRPGAAPGLPDSDDSPKMYTQFFGLTEKPFSITPDPHFLFMSERHAEALAHLVYGVTESGGFIQLTGEVGTGKTTLTRSLLERLPDTVDLAAILNPRLTVHEFLRAIFDELRIPIPEPDPSNKDLVDALNRYLLDAHARGRRTVVLVDEAQNLDSDVLEQLRLLTNLETSKHKLLQIILVGQPELRTLLARNDLRQLAQRITGRYHLEKLNAKETVAYVRHRLTVAGALSEIFAPGALWDVHRLSGGVPRLINVLCDRALLGAFSAERHRVTRAMVRAAAREVGGAPLPARGRAAWWRPAGGIAAALALVAIGVWGASTLWRPTAPAAPVAASPGRDGQSPTPFRARALRVSERLAPLGTPAVAAQTPAPAADALADLLADPSIDTGTDAAFNQLFALWGTRAGGAGTAPCAHALEVGLRCAFQVGSLRLLRTMNRPAILSLVDTLGTPHNAVLVRLDEQDATLRLGGTDHRVGVADLSQHWLGEYLVLWRPLHGDDDLILPGTRGPQVAWLRETLGRVQSLPLASDDPTYFDATLRRQVQAFQRSRRLEADGKAGVQTLIAINSALAMPGTPSLERL